MKHPKKECPLCRGTGRVRYDQWDRDASIARDILLNGARMNTLVEKYKVTGISALFHKYCERANPAAYSEIMNAHEANRKEYFAKIYTSPHKKFPSVLKMLRQRSKEFV